MGFLDKILKRKEEKRQEKLRETRPVRGANDVEKKEKAAAGAHSAGAMRTSVLRSALITEKANTVAGERKYIFLVSPRAGKKDIREAVRERYNVSVHNVHVLNMPGKVRRRGRQIGMRPGFKKAIVTLTEGDAIEIT